MCKQLGALMWASLFTLRTAAKHPKMLEVSLHLNDTFVLRRLFRSLLVRFDAVRLKPSYLLGTAPPGGSKFLKESSGDEDDSNACDAYRSQQ
mmetsp:Transcript_89088/g.123705  ORF Transcript_89088/g.123705 Transcript_89088/m.123705 type:complete len:92 (-) Transcript_89088:116-391(-)